jgi:hypothetical protein
MGDKGFVVNDMITPFKKPAEEGTQSSRKPRAATRPGAET